MVASVKAPHISAFVSFYRVRVLEINPLVLSIDPLVLSIDPRVLSIDPLVLSIDPLVLSINPLVLSINPLVLLFNVHQLANCHNPNSTSTQLKIGCDMKITLIHHHPPPPTTTTTTHTNSMSAISQLLLTRFQPNFKVRFLG